MILTRQLILAGSTTGLAGWNKEQLAVLGVGNPPRKGWMGKLVGREIPDSDYELFLSLQNKKNNYHPKASLDTNPGESAVKQSGAAPSTLCEVGIGADSKSAPTNATADRTSVRCTPYNLTQFREALHQAIDNLSDTSLTACLDIANNKLWKFIQEENQ